jgi:thymidylate kinase
MTTTEAQPRDPLAVRRADPQQGAVPGPAPAVADAAPALELVARLCDTLAAEGVLYNHWKSNEAIDRSMSGDNDLDVLVARRDHGRFLEVLARLGFRAAALPHEREVPSVVHYYGLDAPSGRLVHVHAHFRLVLGDDTTKNFWLPVEDAYLASSTQDGMFPLPAPEFELAVLVLRLVLKHATWDSMAQLRGATSASELRELDWLQQRAGWDAVDQVVHAHLPFVSAAWPLCRRALEPGASPLTRVRAARELTRALEACSRRPAWQDVSLRLTRRVTWGARRYVLRKPTRKRLVTGGAVIALVGGDGAGKSTAVEGVSSWLSRAFVVRGVHLGRPPKSLTTVLVKGALVTGRRAGLFPELAEPTAPPADPTRPPSTAWLAWQTLTARDRYRLYVRARRVAANGGIVVCDRFPLAELRSMDGARTAWTQGLPLGRVGTRLARAESYYYSAFGRPDVLLVLRVDPETAVLRKPEEEEHYVRRRSTEVWHTAWQPPAVVIDASRPAPAVLADLRAAVWERL